MKLLKKNNNNVNPVKPVIQNHSADYTEEVSKKEQLRKNKHKWKTANNSNNIANEVKDKSLEVKEPVEQTVSVVEEVKVVESNAGLEEAQAVPKKTKRRYRNKKSNKKRPANTAEDTEKNAES